MFDAIQKRAVKWINGCRYDHYSDLVYYEKQKELNILPIKFNFMLNDLILLYKIIHSLVIIKLPDHFTFLRADQTRCTRQTSILTNNIIESNAIVTDMIAVIDPTILTCSNKRNCDCFENCFFI